MSTNNPNPNPSGADVPLGFQLAIAELVNTGKPNTAEALRTAVADLLARNAEHAEQISEAKQQWDRVANAIGADCDCVDDVFAKADTLAADNLALREALSRQGDNMAFVLNNCDVPEVWFAKLDDELKEDRDALARTSAATKENGND